MWMLIFSLCSCKTFWSWCTYGIWTLWNTGTLSLKTILLSVPSCGWINVLAFDLSLHQPFFSSRSIVDFCVDFASILRRFSTLKVGLRPKSWNSSSLNWNSENPFIYWDSRKFPLFSCLGARTDSNRRHSEPQSDALTNWTTGTMWLSSSSFTARPNKQA